MKQLLLIGLFIGTLCATNSYAQIIINEVQYGNKTTLLDKDGDSPDWIELHNTSNAPVHMDAYSINDSKSLADAWVFPDISIPANGYILVYASGKEINTKDNLHTNFKLRTLKDSLFLFDKTGSIIDFVLPQCVPNDISLGFIENHTTRQLISPTPGGSNTNSKIFNLDFKSDTLMVDKPSGRYNTGIELNFSKRQASNDIFFTLNGNEPDDESTLFTGAIALNDISSNENRFAQKVEEFEPGDFIAKANIIRAQVYSDGCPASNEIANTYFIASENTFQYNVPIISIITDKDNLFDEEKGIYVTGNHLNFAQKGSAWERDAHIEYFDTAGIQVINQDAGIRIHGRTSRWASQKSFRIYAKEKYGNETFQYPFFKLKPELNEFKTLILRTTYGDWSETLFKDELCHNIVDPMDIDNMAAQTNVLFINGEYWGIYSLRERQDEYYIENNHGIKDTELDIISFDNGTYVKSGTIDNYQNLLDWLNTNDPKASHFYDDVAEKIDLNNITDYFIAQLYLAHFDFPKLNIDMWRSVEDTAKWRYFFFDLDAAMIKINYDHLSNYNNTIENLERFKYEEEYILSRLLENERFRNNFYLSYLHHMETTFNTERILNLIDYYEKQYTPLIAEQSYRWGKPTDIHNWVYNLNLIKTFTMQRPSVVFEQLIKNFENPFTIYPNPSLGQFTLFIDDPFSNNISYSIYNAQGYPVINNKPLHTDATDITVNLNSGIYMMRVKVNGLYFREKLIVQ